MTGKIFFNSGLSGFMSLLFVFCSTLVVNAQNNTNQSIPTFDKLFKLKWKISTDNYQLGEPVYQNGIVFFTAEKDFAVDAETGEKLYFKDSIASKIIKERVKDSIMLFSQGSYSHMINIYTGKELKHLSFHSSYPSYVNPRILTNSAIIRSSGDESILNFKLIERYPFVKLVWIFNSKSTIYDDYIKLDSNLLVFDETDLYCLNNKNRQIAWQYTIGTPISSNPVINGNTLYFVKEKDMETNTLCSFNLDTKSLNWSYDFPYKKVMIKIVLHMGTIYFAGKDGIYFIDSKSGAQKKFIKGNYAGEVMSQIDKYIILLNYGSEGVAIPTAIDMYTGEIAFRKFTSKGFPPISIENMSDEAKRMKANGEIGWDEGFGWNSLDGGDLLLVEDKETGLIFGNNGSYYCFELVK